jgi:dCTP deaminase
MAIKSDRWIRRMAKECDMIDPFEPTQVREGEHGRVISYGTSSYGYDIRCADEFKIFTNINSAIVDPKNFDSNSFVDLKSDVCIIPPNSFALARTVEYFRIPRNVLTICLGKSTYARCGIIVNVTPLEPEWEGHVTLEFSNTTPLPAKIYANEGVAQILFFESDEVCETSYKDRGGKYQGQRGVTLPLQRRTSSRLSAVSTRSDQRSRVSGSAVSMRCRAASGSSPKRNCSRDVSMRASPRCMPCSMPCAQLTLLDAFLDALLDKAFCESGHFGSLPGIPLTVELLFILVQGGVDVDEVGIFQTFLGMGLQLDQTAHGMRVDREFLLRRVGHARQREPCHQVATVEVLARGDREQRAGEVMEIQVGGALAAQAQARRRVAAVQEDHHRHHALGLEQLGQVEAVMCQPVDREALRVGLFLDHEQECRAPSVRPFDQQRHVQLPKALAQAFLELLPANRHDARPRIDRMRLDRRKEGD